MELLVVILIIGILVTLALTQYGPYKERTLDKEAQANLKLLLAAQKVYRLEVGFYYPYNATGTGSESNIDKINTDLRLLLSNADNTSWNYRTTADYGAATTCVEATRIGAGSRTFSLPNDQDESIPGGTCGP